MPCCAGFDYGTSNCAIGVLETSGQVRLLPLEADGSPLVASTLYAPRADFELGEDEDALQAAAGSSSGLRFGQAALDAYLRDPEEGYFIKSPKSFLGAPGLNHRVIDRFVTVVAAMMRNVRLRAEQALGEPIEQVVIGRPVNFQGAGGEAENQQAQSMLVAAAREAGFGEVRFLFEPMAAAMEFEARQNDDTNLLVVDIGGGTTDCSFVRVGPERRLALRREDDVLGHAGERLGGNDYDQGLALRCLMPELGLGDALRSGLPIPNTYFVDAVSTNDVNAQARFYSRDTTERLGVFTRDAQLPQRIARLARLQAGRATYRLLRSAELAKIALSEEDPVHIDLSFLEPGLGVDCGVDDLSEASERLLAHLAGLVHEVVRQAGTRPDVVYLTGGMARSPIVRAHLATALDGVPMADSDHFVSVTSGLALWADRIFRA